LESLAHHPTLGLLGEYNLLTSRLSNYGQKLIDIGVDEKVYPSYQIAGMVSGRFKCTEPNIQNQPRSGFKHIYTVPDGYCFITGDPAQVEIRVAGLLSKDPVINQAYAEGRDLHRLMASKITGKPESEITKAERQAAKAVNFGLIFGGGARMLRQTARTQYHTDMTLAEAQRAKDIFHATYAGLTEYQRLIVKHTNQLEESETWGCRLTRHYTWKDYYATGEYKDIYTRAINFPVQGSAWEILANAILYIDSNASDGIQISHHVYDELVLLAPEEKRMEATHLLKDAFIYGYETLFPGCCKDGIVEIGAGENWSKAGRDEEIILR
jgi:DNA polymerase I-like protein with 3'-5' exonuclease and polymerase domains